MSRAYRIKVRESARHVVRARDGVGTQLEILGILPADETAQLLAAELERRGFTRQGATLERHEHGVTVTVDPQTGTVTAKAEASDELKLSGDREGWVYTDTDAARKQGEDALRGAIQSDLKRQAQQREAELQKSVTDRLERELGDVRKELDQVVNRVTAEALKRKAAQLGQIKELTEDPQSGSLTIVVEV